MIYRSPDVAVIEINISVCLAEEEVHLDDDGRTLFAVLALQNDVLSAPHFGHGGT
jgi:hypothetical protein